MRVDTHERNTAGEREPLAKLVSIALPCPQLLYSRAESDRRGEVQRQKQHLKLRASTLLHLHMLRRVVKRYFIRRHCSCAKSFGALS